MKDEVLESDPDDISDEAPVGIVAEIELPEPEEEEDEDDDEHKDELLGFTFIVESMLIRFLGLCFVGE